MQYSTLSLRGTGTHSDASFSGPEPWNAPMYAGWGIIFVANVNSNTVVQTHCEGSGGCVLIDGPGCFENRFVLVRECMFNAFFFAIRPDTHSDSEFEPKPFT